MGALQLLVDVIVNMMIVIPMLIETFTFGVVFTHVLGSNPNTVIMFAGILLGCAAAVMTWIREPPIVRDVDELTALPAIEAA